MVKLKKLIYKIIPIVTACILLFTTIGGTTGFAAESLESTQEKILNVELNDINQLPTESFNGPRINLESEVQPQFIFPIVPLLVGVTIRFGVSFVARTAAGNVGRVSAHAAEQAVTRKISAQMMDKSLSSGLKYVDKFSGERITWYRGNQTAVLLKKTTDEVSTVYLQPAPKASWVRKNWEWFGDVK